MTCVIALKSALTGVYHYNLYIWSFFDVTMCMGLDSWKRRAYALCIEGNLSQDSHVRSEDAEA